MERDENQQPREPLGETGPGNDQKRRSEPVIKLRIAAPDDPIYSRGWTIGSAGPRLAGPAVPPLKDTPRPPSLFEAGRQEAPAPTQPDTTDLTSPETLRFRPDTYWPDDSIAGRRSRNELERRIEDAHESGDFSRIGCPPTPFAMGGGSYLPELRPNESEIARIAMDSTTWDVISIRARRTKHRILYHVVDEHGQAEWTWAPKSSKQPLTFQELVRLIDGIECGGDSMAPHALREFNLDEGTAREIENLQDFVRVSSDFYPELESWYDAEAAEWAERQLEEIRRADEE